jgi:predicted anti-sigma-YlaC factor YlaD
MPTNRRVAGLLKLVILIAVIVAGNLLTRGIVDGLDLGIRPSTEPLLHQIIMTSMAAYIVLMAIPFVPGVEIGLALIVGMSRLFSIPRYVLVVAVAISPIPIVLMVFGDKVANWPI